jgi:hypothetical protein
MGQSRVFYSMSRDGLVPKVFSDLHPHFRTPYKSNLIFMGFVGVFATFVPAEEWQAQKAQTGRSPPAKQIMPGRDKHQPRNTLQGRPGCAVPRQLLCPAPCNMSCPTSPRAERRPIIGRRGLMIQAMQVV